MAIMRERPRSDLDVLQKLPTCGSDPEAPVHCSQNTGNKNKLHDEGMRRTLAGRPIGAKQSPEAG